MVGRAAVITVSDSKSRGEGQDESGPQAVAILTDAGFEVTTTEIVPDDRIAIAARLDTLSEEGTALIVTTGGTGVGPRDVTPEATRDVCEREVQGLGELMRSVSLAKTPHASLSRVTAGICKSTLIVNLPGSPGGVRDCLDAVLPVIPHAIRLISGEQGGHLQS